MKLLFEHIQHEVGHFPPVAPDIIKPSAHIVGLSCMLHCDAEFYFLGISYLHTTHKSKKQKQGKLEAWSSILCSQLPAKIHESKLLL